MVVTTLAAMRAALWQAGHDRRLREAVDQLFSTAPEASAPASPSGDGKVYLGTALTLVFMLLVTVPWIILRILHVTFGLFSSRQVACASMRC